MSVVPATAKAFQCRSIVSIASQNSRYYNTFIGYKALATRIQRGSKSLRAMSTVPPQAAGETKEDVLLQYIILRKDLWTVHKWPLGSVIAQGCHASTAALWMSRNEEYTNQYCSPENLDHMHKVVLEAVDEAQLYELAGKMTSAGIQHKLWIEQPENYATCLATAPLPKSAVAPLVKRLKLCKGLN